MLKEVYEEMQDDEITSIVYYAAENQKWDKKTLKQLKDEHNIIFMTAGASVRPLMVIPRKGKNPLLAIGTEDDGCITFRKRYDYFADIMDVGWLDSFIADLTEAKKYAETLKDK